MESGLIGFKKTSSDDDMGARDLKVLCMYLK
jgi:hypothetical protein